MSAVPHKTFEVHNIHSCACVRARAKYTDTEKCGRTKAGRRQLGSVTTAHFHRLLARQAQRCRFHRYGTMYIWNISERQSVSSRNYRTLDEYRGILRRVSHH
jgi:hypothetical protein